MFDIRALQSKHGERGYAILQLGCLLDAVMVVLPDAGDQTQNEKKKNAGNAKGELEKPSERRSSMGRASESRDQEVLPNKWT
jgi:hypothetical protein